MTENEKPKSKPGPKTGSKPGPKPSRALVPREHNMGPAMSLLNDQQRMFVAAMVETGGGNHTRAARMAGYGNTEESTRVAAHRLTHAPKIIAAIKEEADRQMQAGILVGSNALLAIAQDTMHKDRFKAAVALLDRGGLQIVTQHKVIVQDDRADREIMRDIVELAKQQGIDPKMLLGQNIPKDVIDAEFTEVTDEAELVNEDEFTDDKQDDLVTDDEFTWKPNEA